MEEYTYDNDPGEQTSEEAERREVIIYESSDLHEGHKAVTLSAVHQQPRE